MKKLRRWARIFILLLLFIPVFVPVFLLSNRLKHPISDSSEGFIEDLASIKHRTDALKLNAIKQEEGEGQKVPILFVYKDVNDDSVSSFNSPDENSTFVNSRRNDSIADLLERNGSETSHGTREGKRWSHQEQISSTSRAKDSGRVADEKLKEMKDHLIRARAYVNFAAANSNSHLVKELKLRMKELERAMGEATRDSDLSRRAQQRMKSLETSLSKASRIYPDCSAMTKKLRAMTYNAEELVRTQNDQATYLIQLAGRTTPKGLHCLSMRLTAEFFALQPEEREILAHRGVYDPDLFHFVVLSDNVLACAAVVDSTISSAMEPQRIIFHVVTDDLNFPAISMWFFLNPPANATVQIHNIDKFAWFSTKYKAFATQGRNSQDPKYTSTLNHARFYLPSLFKSLNKVLLLDHDVIVQKDLTELWSVDMKGKVNGAVESCRESASSVHRMDALINFSDPMIARRFDMNACTWTFGVNILDLQEWRRQNLTGLYLKYLQMGRKRPVWKAGTLPLGWVTFYNQTIAVDKRWHVHSLGCHPTVSPKEIEQAAVIHYDGAMKPWLDIGIDKYKKYWIKHVNYSHPYFQQCNIHE